MMKQRTTSPNPQVIDLDNYRKRSAGTCALRKSRNVELVAQVLPHCIINRKNYKERQAVQLLHSALNYLNDEFKSMEENIKEHILALVFSDQEGQADFLTSINGLLSTTVKKAALFANLHSIEQKIGNDIAGYFKQTVSLDTTVVFQTPEASLAEAYSCCNPSPE